MSDLALSLATLSPDETAATLDRVGLNLDEIAAYCDRWHVTEFALFGSILREDFRPDSDLDCLVVFAAGVRISLFDLVEMQHDLGDRIGRSVDVVMRSSIEASDNYIRRAEILDTARIIYPPAEHATPSCHRPHQQLPPSMTKPNNRDRASLLDILKAAKLAREFGQGMTKSDLERDDVRCSAILYQLTILGEATKRLSRDFRDRYNQIQWQKIAGTRDFLIHEYDAINLDIVVDIINDDLLVFIPAMEALVREFC
jgi:uncharacterized protein with HEPN domain/predicted nucleotidyltransferase